MLVIIICMVFIDFYPYGFGAWKNQSDSILIVVAFIIKTMAQPLQMAWNLGLSIATDSFFFFSLNILIDYTVIWITMSPCKFTT